MAYYKNSAQSLHNLLKYTMKICISFWSRLQGLYTLATKFKKNSCSKYQTVNSFLQFIIKTPIQKTAIWITLFANTKFYISLLYPSFVQNSKSGFLILNIRCQISDSDILCSFHIRGSIYQGNIYFLRVAILSFPPSNVGEKKYCISLQSSKSLCMSKN